MGRIVVFLHITMDGVIQAPGGIDEDRRGGFEYGGWAKPNQDEEMARFVGEGMSRMKGVPMLFGRRTYEHFASVWPTAPQPNPFTDVLNNTRKYVASRTLRTPLRWQNSTLIEGDAIRAVATLKERHNLLVLGSGELVQSLMRHGLIDEYQLLVHPIALGRGRRLFPEDGTFARLRLAEARTTTKGVVIARYEAASYERESYAADAAHMGTRA